jgi:hypothetical protein
MADCYIWLPEYTELCACTRACPIFRHPFEDTLVMSRCHPFRIASIPRSDREWDTLATCDCSCRPRFRQRPTCACFQKDCIASGSRSRSASCERKAKGTAAASQIAKTYYASGRLRERPITRAASIQIVCGRHSRRPSGAPTRRRDSETPRAGSIIGAPTPGGRQRSWRKRVGSIDHRLAVECG